MSLPLTPSKRQSDRGFSESNEKGKWQKTTGSYSQTQSSKIPIKKFVFRLLCPSLKIGGVIGRGGSIISQIRRETGAKIRVEEAVLGSDERVVLITGSEKVKVSSDHAKNENEESSPTDKGTNEEENDEGKIDKESVPREDRPEGEISSAQKALLRVFGRIAEDGVRTDGEDEDSSKYTARLLVFSNEVGCLLGKDENIIKQMSAESGAQVHVLPRDKLPVLASLSDELVQITGGLDACKKALQLVSRQILDNSATEHDSFPPSSIGASSHSFISKSDLIPPTTLSSHVQGPRFLGTVPHGSDYHSPAAPKFHDFGVPARMKPPQDIVMFRLLCHAERAGQIVGRGGTIIRGIELDTGCEIKVSDNISDPEDRIIIISGRVRPDERVSGAQEAVLRIQNRISGATPEDFEKKSAARILVFSSQIGCLIGMGGSIIAEMRKISGAQIRILGKEQIPKCASENEEVVQISGDFETVQNALLQVTSRLQNHVFGDAFPSINYKSNPVFPDQDPPFSSYIGGRGVPSPGAYSSLGPPLHKFDQVGGLPHNDFHGPDDRPFMNRPVFPPFSERRPFSSSWGPMGPTDNGGSISMPDTGGILSRRFSSFGGGPPPPTVTNTTFEVRVPCGIIPLICGNDGDGCLQQIREISEAKITVTEPKMGAMETVILISGAPDQTHAAQSLIQAFVLSENETS